MRTWCPGCRRCQNARFPGRTRHSSDMIVIQWMAGHVGFGKGRARSGNYERHHPTTDIQTKKCIKIKKSLHFRPERTGERAESCSRHVSARSVASVK